jgi:hypothetical protein
MDNVNEIATTDITVLPGETFAAWAMRVWDWDVIGDPPMIEDDDGLCPGCAQCAPLLVTVDTLEAAQADLI